MSFNLQFSYTIAQVRSNIPVTEFPDYVLHTTQEDEYNGNYLTGEFLVNIKTFAWVHDSEL